MAARYKDKELNKAFNYLVGKTPDKLYELKIFGAMHSSFKFGYDGHPIPHYIPRNTPAYAAYYAGKETRRRMKRGRLIR